MIIGYQLLGYLFRIGRREKETKRGGNKVRIREPKIAFAYSVLILALMLILISNATASATSVSIGSMDTTLGECVTMPIMIENAEEVINCATILLIYDSSIAKVSLVEKSDFDSLVYNIDNANGRTKIVVYQTGESGLIGDIKIADVTIEAVGIGSSSLNLQIETLKNSVGDEVSADAISGSLEVKSSGTSGESGGSTPTPTPTPTPSPSSSPSPSPSPHPVNETIPSSPSPSPSQPEEQKITVVYTRDISVEKGKTANTSIEIKGVEGKGLSYANVTLNYNPSVVKVEGAGESDFDSFIYNVPSKGCLKMLAYQTGAEGLKGNVKFAEIKLKAVGKANESSELRLEIKELKDNEGHSVHFEVKNGYVSIKGGEKVEESSKAIPSLSMLEIMAVIIGSYLIIRRRK